VARRADAVVAISAPLRADLITRGVEPDHVHVVPNGVDAVVHAPREPDPELVARLRLEGAVCLGYVGSLYPFEGVEDLVRAMPLILREAPRTRLLIVGRDPQARIAKLVGALSLEGQVHALGAVPRSETRRYYSVMDVLIYPRTPNRTTRLVTPLKPLEALAMAKPVIASDVGGLRELLGDQALFFRAGDREDLAARCLELLRAPEQRLAAGRRGRQHVLAERQWSRVLRAYAALYEQVCK
jgi:glycosyltransferase involved in cell wall biosynthesis